jgi:hypothetical protein
MEDSKGDGQMIPFFMSNDAQLFATSLLWALGLKM